jgi:hypothetical protein
VPHATDQLDAKALNVKPRRKEIEDLDVAVVAGTCGEMKDPD